MSEEAIALVKGFFAGIESGSIDGALSVMAENVEWTPTIWSGTGTYWGLAETRSWFEQFGPGLEDLRIELREVESSDGGAFASGIVHDSRQGDAFAAQIAAVLRGQQAARSSAARLSRMSRQRGLRPGCRRAAKGAD